MIVQRFSLVNRTTEVWVIATEVVNCDNVYYKQMDLLSGGDFEMTTIFVVTFTKYSLICSRKNNHDVV